MSLKQLSEDALQLLTALVAHQVRFLVVGGAAVIYYGYARYTGDLDLFYDSTGENCARLYAGLVEFWDGQVPGLHGPEDLLKPGSVIQFGVPPHRVDLLNSIDGISFSESYANSVSEMIESPGASVPIRILSLTDLLTNKKASGRPKDQDDIEHLS